jgi:hypothetical protein
LDERERRMSFPPVPTGFDPTKMMEYMAALPEDQRNELLQEAMGQMDDLQQKAEQGRSREGARG